MSDIGWKADVALPRFCCLPVAMASKRIRRRVGDLLKVNLADGRHSYAQVADEPLIVFFDGAFTEDASLDVVITLPVLFRIWVHNDAVRNGTWSVVGNLPLSPDNAAEPYFFKQDAVTGALALYHSSFADTGWERSASATECYGLECAAVWDPEHVEDRLRDYYAGRPNQWVESLRIDKRALS
ncbi:MAG: Imm26 family immunity protein [Tsuneonella sp.]